MPVQFSVVPMTEGTFLLSLSTVSTTACPTVCSSRHASACGAGIRGLHEAGAIEEHIAVNWHVIALNEAIEYLQHECLTNHFHVMYTEYTPTACMTYNTVCSQARTDTECVLVAQELNGSVALYHLCASKKNPSSGQPCHPLAGLFHISSLPVYHSTQHYLDSATFSKKTLYTQNHFLKSPNQKLQETQSGRNATLKNHSLTPKL